MHKTIAEATQFLQDLLPKVKGAKSKILIAPPFTALAACAKLCKGSAIQIGAQNMSDKDEGAFTGEISAAMLKEAGASFVLLGHSERREHFGETDLHIHQKLKQSIAAHIPAILCIGEKQEAREVEADRRLNDDGRALHMLPQPGQRLTVIAQRDAALSVRPGIDRAAHVGGPVERP